MPLCETSPLTTEVFLKKGVVKAGFHFMGNSVSHMRFSHFKMCGMAFQGPRATKHLLTHFGFKAVGVCT